MSIKLKIFVESVPSLNYELCPKLEEVLTKLLEVRPILEFSPYNYHRAKVTKVYVRQQGFLLGSICSDVRRQRGEGSEYWFGVKSPFIKKERGDKNELISKSVKKTVDNALSNLIKPALEQTGTALVDQIISHATSGPLLYNIERNVTREIFSRSHYQDDTRLWVYFMKKVTGEEPELPKAFQNLSETAFSAYKVFCSAMNVHQHAMQKNGFAVHWLYNDTYVVSDCREPKHTKIYESVSDMPNFMQEKITLLKILGQEEPAENIGVRFGDIAVKDPEENTRLFFIVDGATVLM
ncbi:MAG: hypothetical protein EBR82_30500 [Caulobacteraceae bacterium]|nr:hypothetical protein [Caulobacteraceae bacterium]